MFAYVCELSNRVISLSEKSTPARTAVCVVCARTAVCVVCVRTGECVVCARTAVSVVWAHCGVYMCVFACVCELYNRVICLSEKSIRARTAVFVACARTAVCACVRSRMCVNCATELFA